MTENPEISLEAWKVTLLPTPKYQSTAKAFGLCGGFAVGSSAGRGVSTRAQWWPQGTPQEITFPPQKHIEVRRARGRDIPGWWEKNSGVKQGAVIWRLGDDGSLTAHDLHPAHYQWSCALAAGGGAIAGYGLPKGKKGEKTIKRALLWRSDGGLVELPAGKLDEGIAQATDGHWVVGWVGETGRQRAALWPADGSDLIELNPPHGAAMAEGVGDGEQVGGVWFWLSDGINFSSQAALWRGSAESFVNLTPEGFERAVASDCAAGLQVGYGFVKHEWPSGRVSQEARALLWAGSAASAINLQALLPEPWNASAAWCIEVEDDHVRIAGEATEMQNRKFRAIANECAVIWEAQLRR